MGASCSNLHSVGVVPPPSSTETAKAPSLPPPPIALSRFNLTLRIDPFIKGVIKRINNHDMWEKFLLAVMRVSLQPENNETFLPSMTSDVDVPCKDVKITISKRDNVYRGHLQWTSLQCDIDTIINSIAFIVYYETSIELNPFRTFCIRPQYAWTSPVDSDEADDPEKVESDSTSDSGTP